MMKQHFAILLLLFSLALARNPGEADPDPDGEDWSWYSIASFGHKLVVTAAKPIVSVFSWISSTFDQSRATEGEITLMTGRTGSDSIIFFIEPRPKPSFASTIDNVTAIIGEEARFDCNVINQANVKVSPFKSRL